MRSKSSATNIPSWSCGFAAAAGPMSARSAAIWPAPSAPRPSCRPCGAKRSGHSRPKMQFAPDALTPDARWPALLSADPRARRDAAHGRYARRAETPGQGQSIACRENKRASELAALNAAETLVAVSWPGRARSMETDEELRGWRLGVLHVAAICPNLPSKLEIRSSHADMFAIPGARVRCSSIRALSRSARALPPSTRVPR